MPSMESRLAFTRSYNDRNYTVGFKGHYDRGKNAGDVGSVPFQTPLNSWGVALDYSLPLDRLLAITGEAYEGNALGIYSVASGEAAGERGDHVDLGLAYIF